MKKFIKTLCIAVLALGLTIAAARADDPVSDNEKICQTDDDCGLIRTSCKTCCPTSQDSVALNKQFKNKYINLGRCAPSFKQNCGVPECGLGTPAPVASCDGGMCIFKMRNATIPKDSSH